jgi:hypothetical protein
MPQGEFKEERDKGIEIDADDFAMQQAVVGMASTERYVRLYRINDQGGRPKLIESLFPQDFNETYVQARFGGGRYQAKWIDKSGKLYKYPFEIEGKPKFPEDEESGEDEGFQTVQPGVQTYTPSQPAGPSFMEIIGLMNEARKDARAENAEMLRLMMEGMRPAVATPQPSGIEQTLGFVKELLPIIGQGGGGGEPMPWYANVLLQLKDPLTKLLDTANTVVANSGKVQPSTRPVQPMLKPSPVEQSEPKEETDMILNQFKSYLPVLLRGASKNTDPAVYVDMILDQVPSIAYAPLRKWLMEPGCLDKLVLLEPGIQYQVEWWQSLQGGLIEALNEELGHGLRSIQPEPDSNTTAVPSTPSSSSDTESE